MSLHDKLTDIRGVGDATAEEIVAIVDAHDEDDAPDEMELVERAYMKLQEGKTGLAEDALARALDK